MTTDPFEELAAPVERQQPRPSFVRELRSRLLAELDLPASDPTEPPTVDLPERKSTMSTTAPAPAVASTPVLPYLTVHDGAAAIDWYVDALGAVEQFRVVGDDGKLGHAELLFGDARVMLSDEYPEIGVTSPRTIGGTSVALHLTVEDADATYARAVAAGATGLQAPADQPHGARHGTILDPFGHRWMVSQTIEDLSIEDYADQSEGTGFTVEIAGAGDDETITVADRAGTGGGIWAGVFYDDALAGIRFLVDTFGFEEQLVVVGDDGRTVVHSQLRWPEGGIVQAGTHDPDNEFTHPPGEQALYVVTADPGAIWERCQAAGVEVVRAPESPDYDPDGMGFGVKDPEGNIWSFGTYGI